MANQQVDRLSSLDDLVRRAASSTNDDRSSARRHPGRDSWDFGAGFDGAMNLARRGWREGTKAVDALTMRIGNRLVTKLIREDWNHDVTGVEIDVATMLAGEPECWLVPEETHCETAGRGYGVVKIVVCGAASCGIDAVVMQRKGAAAAALAILLERTGRPVAIDVAFTAERGNEQLVTMVNVKQPGEPLDVDRIAFALTHPACFRRIVFAAWESKPERVRRTFGFHKNGGYGSPVNCVAEADRGDVYIPSSHYDDGHWHSENTAVAWVADYLRSYGVLND